MVERIIRFAKEKIGIKKTMFFVCLALFGGGMFFDIKNISLCAVIILFLFNIVENLINEKKSIFYIIFHGMIFLFILSRPFISFLKRNEWWYFSSYTIYVAIFVLLLSLMFLNIGFYTKTKKEVSYCKTFENINQKIKKTNGKYDKWLRNFVIITLLASFIKEYINMLYFYGNYVEIYLGKTASVPIVFTVLAGLSFYFMVFYLASLPKKRDVIIILGLYLMTGVPGIIIGGRNALMIKALFCVVYFILRENIEKKSKWIGKKEIIAIIFAIPILMVALGILNYTRNDEEVPTYSPIEISIDFLYKQGTSFDTLCQSIEYRNSLRDDYYINYTFGELIDFIKNNPISNFLFDTADLGDGNNIMNGVMSNKLAHRVSYLALGDNYLAGQGRGTTYFSEIYLDFGYLGIIIFNFVIGFFISIIGKIFNTGLVQRIIILNCLLYFFMIPRVSFFSIFSFTISYYFWIFVILILLIFLIYKKKRT